jgi:hypothetical protein
MIDVAPMIAQLRAELERLERAIEALVELRDRHYESLPAQPDPQKE